MPDGVPVTAGTGTTIATDLIAGSHYQRVKVTFGDDGASTDASTTNPLPVTLPGAVAVTGTFYQATQPVSGTVAVSGTIPVSGTFYQATQPVSIAASVAVTGTFWQATQPISGSVGIAGSVAVTGTFYQATQPVSIAATVTTSAAQSGTWNITNISGTVSLPTGAATETSLVAQSAKLPASLGAKAGSASLSTVAATDDYGRLAATTTSLLLSAAASTNATSVKGSAGALKGIQGYNAASSARYLKLYNKATSPTVGTDTPVKTLYLPAATAFAFDFPAGLTFATGIAYALTGAAANADTTALTAADIVCLNVDYI